MDDSDETIGSSHTHHAISAVTRVLYQSSHFDVCMEETETLYEMALKNYNPDLDPHHVGVTRTPETPLTDGQ